VKPAEGSLPLAPPQSSCLPCRLQDEVPAQQEMRIAGVNGFLPYKATAELIYAALVGCGLGGGIGGMHGVHGTATTPSCNRQCIACVPSAARHDRHLRAGSSRAADAVLRAAPRTLQAATARGG